MKKTLIIGFALFGILGISQTKKKTVKKPVKKTYIKKKTTVKTITENKEVAPFEEVTKSIEVTTISTDTIPQKEEYQTTAERVLKKNGSINNRNSAYVRGIEGFVKDVYVGNGKIYVLLEIKNKTNFNYDIESISFITSPIQKGNRQVEVEEKIFAPVWSNQPQQFEKKSTKKLVYVFDKFNISDNKTLLFIMNEIDGERTLILEIKPQYIINANIIT